MSNFGIGAVGALWIREMKRFYRQPSRLMGAFASPLVFWLLIGSGIGKSFQAGPAAQRVNYLEYFFPGSLLLILLFTAIFSTISLIEDRREGFLQSVLVAPVSRSALVLGKIAGGATIAFVQGMLFMIVAPFLGLKLSLAGWLLVALVLAINACGMTALGFMLAWRMNSIQGFHAVMNLFLMPMWLLSGALFPAEGAPVWIRAAIYVNPLSYGLAALRHALYGGEASLQYLPSFGVSLLLTAVFAVLLFAGCVFLASKRRAEDLPS